MKLGVQTTRSTCPPPLYRVGILRSAVFFGVLDSPLVPKPLSDEVFRRTYVGAAVGTITAG